MSSDNFNGGKDNISIFDVDLFGALIPDELKIKAPEPTQTSGKNEKNGKGVKRKQSSASSRPASTYTPPKEKIVAVCLPVEVCYARERITLAAEDFDESDFLKDEDLVTDSSTSSDSTDVVVSNNSGNEENASEDEEQNLCDDNDVPDTGTTTLQESSASEVVVDEMQLFANNVSVDSMPDALNLSNDNALIAENKPGEENKIPDTRPKVAIDTIRELLEKDFPELDQARTKMDYIPELNRVIPVVFSGSKGAKLSPAKGYHFSMTRLLKDKRALNVIACRDGLYKVALTPFGLLSVKAEDVQELDYGAEGLKLFIPKIPVLLLHQIISFFLDVAVIQNQHEALAKIYWDIREKRHFVDIPLQRVTPVSVNYFDTSKTHVDTDSIRNYLNDTHEDVECVLSVHSHPTYIAEFSPIDNHDEVKTGIYSVISLLPNGVHCPDITNRIAVSGSFLEAPIDTIFEIPELSSIDLWKKVDYPKTEWFSKLFVNQDRRMQL